MRRPKRLFPLLALAFAVLFAQSVGGRLRVQCADGSPCPLKKVDPKPCCLHKPCDQPLLPTCVVVKTPSVETIKPHPADAPAAPFLALAPAPLVLAIEIALPQRFVRAPEFDDSSPPALPILSVQGPRPPPAA